MNVALCYESVLPARGGCETYIADLTHRLVRDGHAVHIYACRWDASRLPESVTFHELKVARFPRFLRPWRFAAACDRALAGARHDVSVGFDKTWGQDVLYPQGGLHAASADHNLRKFASPVVRSVARTLKRLDPSARSFARLERTQYLGGYGSLVVANSDMVRGHFGHYYGIAPESVRVVRSAIDPARFAADDRPRRRAAWRSRWRFDADETVALFLATNYRLKGLEPLLRSLRHLPERCRFKLAVAGRTSNGPYETLARRLGVAERVRFVGFYADPRDAYFGSDLLAHPTFYDPCSLVVLEALACGLPVVTSRYNGASELLSPPDEGFVIDDPHDGRRLGQCLTLLLDPERRAGCAAAARQAAARWTFEHHYHDLLAAFAEAAAARRARAA
jgi:UDP-glucose:(heptosyl)LPS alpha-1,3-glucosyltransferase